MLVQTSLSNIFKNNTLIVTTSDLCYFIAVRSIVQNAFVGCSHLTTFNTPPNITSLAAWVFSANSTANSVSTITLNEGLMTIGDGCFAYTSANPITIPSTVTRLGSMFIRWGVPSKRIVIMEGTTPPTLANNAFFDVDKIYVPDDYVDTYKSSSGWTTYASKVYPVREQTG